AFDCYVQEREAIIERQQSEMTEVSAPVVKIWERIVTVPLLGTLDSFRAQTVMENLLQSILEREAEVAIIDITGVSTVDTMVAQHLLRTAAAVRLMGAECVISGLSPKIAQTIVHLGVELPNVVTRSDLQSGLAYAFERIGLSVRPQTGQ
ncbi:MAG: STAS domain-containing protein, partial [Pararhizobium sp.]